MKNSKVKNWGPWKENPSILENFYESGENLESEEILESNENDSREEVLDEKLEENEEDPYSSILKDL